MEDQSKMCHGVLLTFARGSGTRLGFQIQSAPCHPDSFCIWCRCCEGSGSGGFSDNSNKVVNSTALSLQLELLSNSVASGDSDAANRVIEYLQGILLPTSGQSSRPNKVGGVQYRAEYMLDCVLLSDNLRAVHAEEPDLLTTVVKQRLGCILLLELVEFVGG